MQEILLKLRHFERGLSKTLKKVTLFFLSMQSLLMNKDIKNKSGLELVTSCSSGYVKSLQNFFITYSISSLNFETVRCSAY